jgi:steroid delta-isomerase-like uncharacterized protein
MNYHFAITWLKAFRDSPETVCKLYADDSLFEDLMLDQSITDKDDLHRVFAPYANADHSNGVGVHNFGIHEYIGNRRQGLIRWHWSAIDCAIFLGMPTDAIGNRVATSGQTYHVYNDRGQIQRETTFWDAAYVARALGHDVDTEVARLPEGAYVASSSSNGGSSAGALPGTGLDRAQAWAAALSSDPDRLVAAYADDFTYENRRVADVVDDTITDKSVLHKVVAPYANTDRANGTGIHTFEATEWIGDDRTGVILWNWSATDIAAYRGIATGGADVKTFGQTWQQYGDDGRIVRESTFWNDVPAFQALGLPVLTVHYWDADFDPSSLVAS